MSLQKIVRSPHLKSDVFFSTYKSTSSHQLILLLFENKQILKTPTGKTPNVFFSIREYSPLLVNVPAFD